jgi:hypothetical protein
MHLLAGFVPCCTEIVHLYTDRKLGARGVAPADGFLENLITNINTKTFVSHCLNPGMVCLPRSPCNAPMLV